MAKIFRFSGYFVDNDVYPYEKDDFEYALKGILQDESCNFKFQQLHIEESQEFEPDEEFEDNCDLALLTRHFKKGTITEYDRPLPQAGQKYRHFKLGKIVTVIGISRHTETEEISVVYEYEGTIWNRPLEMFMSEVDREKYPDATQKYRFEKMESAECEKNQ